MLDETPYAYNDRVMFSQARPDGRFAVRYRDGRTIHFDREILARMAASAADYARLWLVQDGKRQRLAF